VVSTWCPPSSSTRSRHERFKLLLAQSQYEARYFLPADSGEGHFVGVVRVLDRVCTMARLEHVAPHTLRHTFASVAGDLCFSELTIATLLGHSARGVTQRYIHIDEALRLAADRIADEMADILDGGMPIARPQRRGARQPQETQKTEETAPRAAL
jgi:integrase